MASISLMLIFLVSKSLGYDNLLALSNTSVIALVIYFLVIFILEKSFQNAFKLFLSGERRIAHLIKIFASHPY
jgi:hypothetical protein